MVSLIRLYRAVTNGAPLQIIGIRDPDAQPRKRLPYSL